jgi:SAM-dependent methyltransferase
MAIRAITDLLVRPFGYKTVRIPGGFRVTKRHDNDLVYIHQYVGGYDEYRDMQVFTNKRKLNKVWADDGTLAAVASYVSDSMGAATRGICHGARNGYEVEKLRALTKANVIGTDISETATQFPNMVVWDFHEPNPEWQAAFDFIYTNSLDQAMRPDAALAVWAKQLAPGGLIFIEHTMGHSAQGASEMDPFGAHPMCMPYLFFKWGKGLYRLEDILEPGPKANNGEKVWMFVLRAENNMHPS